MSIFREFDSGGRDRAAEDRRRHRELVEDAIKKNLGSIISQESIIGQSHHKKIKIPIKGIKEYQFIYGRNIPGVGTGDGTEKRGDRIGEEKSAGGLNNQGQAGDQEGEDIYETEVTVEEIINYMFEDLKLPDLDRKKLSEVMTEISFRYRGYQLKGIPPKLARRRSVIEKIKRKQSYMRTHNAPGSPDQGITEGKDTGTQRFPFTEDDLRYRRAREEKKRAYNAVVICIMDVSGSMDQTKKYLARSFYFLLYQFIRLKYSNVEVVFVAHTTTAKEVNETEFFHRGESGGTYISSGYAKALEIIEQRYSPLKWNIYAFHCSDGDNWTEDNQKAIELAQKLCDTCNLFGYGEIVPGYYTSGSTIRAEYQKNIKKRNFAAVSMSKREDILTGLKKLLDKEVEQ